MAIIDIKGVRKRFVDGYDFVEALKDIDLSIESGEMLAIMGPSGSGKSTLLNILGFMDKPSGGEYILEGEPTQRLNANKYAELRNRKISFIFQDYNLLEDYTVYDNVELPLLHRRMRKKEKKELIMATLEKLGIEDKADTKASKLSGGQKQRVG